MIKLHNSKSGMIAEVLPDSVTISNTDDILQLMVDAGYTHSVQSMILHAINLPSEFFDLKSGFAGEILQKFSNYRMKLAIIGDFSEIKSKSLRDFIGRAIIEEQFLLYHLLKKHCSSLTNKQLKPNTNNIGKLFVTLFAFAPAPRIAL